MFKRTGILLLVCIFILSTTSCFALEKTRDRLKKGMDNVFIGGAIEGPDNLNESKTKGSVVPGGTEKTKKGVERAIARFVGGLWQLGTFWYSDEQ